LSGASVLAWAGDGQNVPLVTRHAVGKGAVILTLVPHTTGVDERPHPALPWLMNGVTQGLLPLDVRLADGSRPNGEIMYQLNRTKDGWLVMLINNAGVDKTQTGIARVDRRAFRDVVIRARQPIAAAKELTQPRELKPLAPADAGPAAAVSELRLRVHPGDVQVVQITSAK
jgi:hypothetical protein